MVIFLKVKVKSTMTDKNFDFNKTRDALSQLSTDLIELESIIKIKQSQIEANNQKTSDLLAEKEQTISQLTKVSQSALEKIENIIINWQPAITNGVVLDGNTFEIYYQKACFTFINFNTVIIFICKFYRRSN